MDDAGASRGPFGGNGVASDAPSTTMGWVSHLQTFDPTSMPRMPVYEGFVPAPDPFGADFRTSEPDEDEDPDEGEYEKDFGADDPQQTYPDPGQYAIPTIELPDFGPSTPSSTADGSTPNSADDGSEILSDAHEASQSTATPMPPVHLRQPAPRRGPGRPKTRKRTGERGGWSRGMKLGPHAPVEPSADFTEIFQKAMHAYNFGSDLDTAHELILQAISMNPEVFNAHILLSDIWFARGHSLNAVQALWTGAHCYSRDPFVWYRVLEACLEKATYERVIALNQAKYALRAILKLTPDDHEARFRLAAVEREAGKPKKALELLNKIMHDMPHNTDALGLYAEVCIGMQKIDVAIDRYKEAIQYYQANGNTEDDAFEWADVIMYVKLLSLREGDREEVLASSIKVLKKLSRWLLGRGLETFWDRIEQDDREFDAEDYPRRLEVNSFRPGRYHTDQYGAGLPMQLRTQLGVLRLKQGDSRAEALNHFEWLDPDDASEDANAIHFGDDFLDVARALNDAKEYTEALRYFEALLRVDVVKEADFWIGIGTSSYVLGQKDRAMEHFRSALACDGDSIVAKTYVSKISAERGEKLQAIKYACEAIEEAADRAPPMAAGVRRYERFEDRANREAAEDALRLALQLAGPNPPKKRQGRVRADGTVLNAFELIKPRKALYKRNGKGRSKRPPRPATPTEDKPQKLDDIRPLYNNMLTNYDMMKAGNMTAIRIWMSCAKSLINDFRANDLFYPPQKHMQFQGYDDESVKASRRRLYEKNSNSTTPQPQSFPGGSPDEALPSIEPQANTYNPPTAYREIPFATWLDIFLQYSALCPKLPPAEFPNAQRDAYNTIISAIQCVIWWHHPPSLFQIHACYLATAVAFRDQITLFGTVLPWFLKEFPFATDAYRLVNLMHSIFPYPNHPSGKAGQAETAYVAKSHKPKSLLFRHIAAIDHHLIDTYTDPETNTAVPPFMRRSRDELLTSWTTDPITNQRTPRRTLDMDVVLLVLYGQLVYAKGQFAPALAYFHRANAIKPREPLVLLTMALSYLQQPLKPSFRTASRASERRHNWVLQGMAFFEEYADARLAWAAEKEDSQGWLGVRQQCAREVEFNRARCWAMLGMADMAVRGFKRVLRREQETPGGGEGMMDVDTGNDNDHNDDDMDMQAAYAMATTYALNGDVETARRITEKYLVVE